MTLPSQQTPGPDHKAASSGLLASLPGRTFLQGVGIDILIALCLVVIQATSSDTVDWRLLLIVLAKTLVQTLASSVMKRLKPPPVSAVK